MNYQFDALIFRDLSGKGYGLRLYIEMLNNLAGSSFLNIPPVLLAGKHMPCIVMSFFTESQCHDFSPDPPSVNRAIPLDGLNGAFG